MKNIISRGWNLRFSFSVLALLALMVGAFADDPPAIDWAATATSYVGSVTNVFNAVVPVVIGLLALFMGPRILKGLAKSFSR